MVLSITLDEAGRVIDETRRNLGVEEVIDDPTTRFEDAVQDVDVVFDTIGCDTQRHSRKRYNTMMKQRWMVLLASIALLLSVVVLSPSSLAAQRSVNTSIPGLPQGFKSSMASVNGVRLHYVIGGKGDPVVLLHGYPETWYAWREVMPALATHYTVIAPDLRGLGDSSHPATGYDTRTVASDIYQLIRHLGFERIFLVAHDYGGTVAYAYTAAHRTDVRKLVMIETFVPGFVPKGTLDYSRANGGWLFAFQSVHGLPEELVTGRTREYLSFLYHSYAYNQKAISKADINEYVRTYEAGGLHDAFEYYRAFFDDADQNQEYAKTKLAMPVLAVGAANSEGTTTLHSMQMVATNVYGTLLNQCGHFVAEECPVELTQQLLPFLANTR